MFDDINCDDKIEGYERAAQFKEAVVGDISREVLIQEILGTSFRDGLWGRIHAKRPHVRTKSR
jgi:hypothetical protein